MAEAARSGLKQVYVLYSHGADECLNGRGSPFGFETMKSGVSAIASASLNGRGSPFGFETLLLERCRLLVAYV